MTTKAKSPVNKEDGKSATTPTQKMDAIKALLFGDDIDEFEDKLKEVFNKLEEYQKEYERRLEELKNKNKEEIKAMKQDFDKKIEKMEKSSLAQFTKLNDRKAEKSELGKIFKSIGEKLQ